MKIKAAVLNKMGAELPYAKSKPLTIEEVELDGPGRGEVLVKIGAAGLCHSDLSVIEGNRPRPTPMVLGHEAAGIVEKLGPDVDDLKVGESKTGELEVQEKPPSFYVGVDYALGDLLMSERPVWQNMAGAPIQPTPDRAVHR